MNLPFLPRLICLCTALFFVVHLLAGSAVSLLAPLIVRWAARLRAAQAAALLCAVRLAPATLGACLVTLICVPSYLRFEPPGPSEEVGTFCLAGSMLCLVVCAISIGRTARAVVMTARYAEHSAGVALLGIFRPRFFVSADLAETLPADELAAALRHEQAHWSAGDNIKRLLFLLSPDLLPGWSGFGRLESNWGRLAEWAADDQAVNGEPQWSLSLAAALVRVARAEVAARTPTLASTLIGERCDLAERVNRILNPQPPRLPSIPIGWMFTSGAALVLTVGATLSTILPNSIYRVLEMFLH
jgi:hypothetical protein